MLRRRFLMGVGLTALGAHQATAGAPVPLVLAIPANRSPEFNKQIGRYIAKLYIDIQPGSRVTVVNASTQSIVAQFIVPDDLGETDRDRDDALLDLFVPVSRFIAVNDPSAQVDNTNIPATLREMKNVLPWFPDGKANVILFGSLNWESKHDATWAFKDHYVMDGFLNERGGPFGVVGEETILRGALVSILFTDPPSAFITTGGAKWVQNFWGKSIKGRGGRVGAIEAFNVGSYSRLFANLEDTTPYVIDTNAPRAIIEPGMVMTPTYRAGQLIPGVNDGDGQRNPGGKVGGPDKPRGIRQPPPAKPRTSATQSRPEPVAKPVGGASRS